MDKSFKLIRECYIRVENKEISRRKLLYYYNCLPINLKINMNNDDIETFCKTMRQVRFERNHRLSILALKLLCISWVIVIVFMILSFTLFY